MHLVKQASNLSEIDQYIVNSEASWIQPLTVVAAILQNGHRTIELSTASLQSFLLAFAGHQLLAASGSRPVWLIQAVVSLGPATAGW